MQASQSTTTNQSELARGIAQFNTWRFWECHETLEELWIEETGERTAFYQGVIKLAAGFHHLNRHNYRGTVHLLKGGLQLLAPYPNSYLGINLGKLRREVRQCVDVIEPLGPEHLEEFDRGLIPHIGLEGQDIHGAD